MSILVYAALFLDAAAIAAPLAKQAGLGAILGYLAAAPRPTPTSLAPAFPPPSRASRLPSKTAAVA